jgi:hypothetical protein
VDPLFLHETPTSTLNATTIASNMVRKFSCHFARVVKFHTILYAMRRVPICPESADHCASMFVSSFLKFLRRVTRVAFALSLLTPTVHCLHHMANVFKTS